MKKIIYTTTRFNIYDNEFYVEVSPYEEHGEKWLAFTLCKEKYGIKSFMFGLKAETCPEEEWENLIEANVYDYIETFIEEMDIWENAFESECVSSGVYEAIEMHNEHVDKMQTLAEALIDQYPDIEETPVNQIFCEAFAGIVGNAIYLCCEANNIDNCVWQTTGDWHVVKDDDTTEEER